MAGQDLLASVLEAVAAWRGDDLGIRGTFSNACGSEPR
jgi:hypothetical protein